MLDSEKVNIWMMRGITCSLILFALLLVIHSKSLLVGLAILALSCYLAGVAWQQHGKSWLRLSICFTSVALAMAAEGSIDKVWLAALSVFGVSLGLIHGFVFREHK